MKLMFKAAPAVAAAMLWGGSAFAAPSLSVNADAAQFGTDFGLEVILDGGTSAAFVQDNSPTAEPTYRARFWLDVNDLDADGTRNQHVIFTANGVGPQGPVVRSYLLNEGANGKWRVRVWCRRDDGTFDKGKNITLGTPGAEPPRLIELTFQAATSDGANDGSCSIQRFGGADPIETSDSLDNDEASVQRVRLGAVTSIDPSTLGSYYLDEFESFR